MLQAQYGLSGWDAPSMVQNEVYAMFCTSIQEFMGLNGVNQGNKWESWIYSGKQRWLMVINGD